MEMTTKVASADNGPFDLAVTPLHVGREGDGDRAVPLLGFTHDAAGFEAYVAKHCSRAEPGRIVMMSPTAQSWASWECHPAGDEIVIVLSGKGVFVQEVDGREQRVAVVAGSAIVNPAGVWHTADVEEPINAIYITPCPGTQHRAR